MSLGNKCSPRLNILDIVLPFVSRSYCATQKESVVIKPHISWARPEITWFYVCSKCCWQHFRETRSEFADSVCKVVLRGNVLCFYWCTSESSACSVHASLLIFIDWLLLIQELMLLNYFTHSRTLLCLTLCYLVFMHWFSEYISQLCLWLRCYFLRFRPCIPQDMHRGLNAFFSLSQPRRIWFLPSRQLYFVMFYASYEL